MTSLIDDVMACDEYTHCRMEQYPTLTLHNEGPNNQLPLLCFFPLGDFGPGPLPWGALRVELEVEGATDE